MTTAIARPQIDPTKIPRSAMRFAISDRMQFAASEGDTQVMPFRMLARSRQPVEHYYWGRIVHDLDGMVQQRDSVTVDWFHSYDEVIGYANQFAVTDAGLEVGGSLVSTETNDRADEIYRKGRAGVPYQASIDWNGSEVELEYIPDGVSTLVNNQQFAGPGYVVRKWPLRAISICRYGVDPDTRTQFSAQESATDTVSVSILNHSADEGSHVSKSTETSPPGSAGETSQQFSQPPAAGTQAGSISIEMLKQFHQEFGPKGTEYLTAGLSLDAARYQFACHERDQARTELKQFAEQLKTKDEQITGLQTQLKQFGLTLGQDKPLETDGKSTGPQDERRQQFALASGDKRAAFASALKLKS